MTPKRAYGLLALATLALFIDLGDRATAALAGHATWPAVIDAVQAFCCLSVCFRAMLAWVNEHYPPKGPDHVDQG